MRILAIDVGGTHVKVLATGHRVPRKVASGPAMTARMMVAAVQRLTRDWRYEVWCSMRLAVPLCWDAEAQEA